MDKTKFDELSSIELLRLIVSNADNTPESFWDDKTPEEIVKIGRMQLLSEWDINPFGWTERQVKEALAGTPPQWRSTSRGPQPVYEPHPYASYAKWQRDEAKRKAKLKPELEHAPLEPAELNTHVERVLRYLRNVPPAVMEKGLPEHVIRTNAGFSDTPNKTWDSVWRHVKRAKLVTGRKSFKPAPRTS